MADAAAPAGNVAVTVADDDADIASVVGTRRQHTTTMKQDIKHVINDDSDELECFTSSFCAVALAATLVVAWTIVVVAVVVGGICVVAKIVVVVAIPF